MIRCKTCDTLIWSEERHVCPPAWTVYVDFTDPLYDGPGASTTVYAANAQIAAINWAEHWDPDHDYILANNEDQTVTVIVSPAGQPDRPVKFIVGAVQVVEYQVLDPEEDNDAQDD